MAANRAHPVALGRETVRPNSLFPLASCSKIFTCAAITELHSSGKLDLEKPVFPLLEISKPAMANQQPDSRINQITVKNLVYHAGGWVAGGGFKAKDGKHIKGANFDPVFSIRKMSLDLRLSHPLTKRQMAEYMYGMPLQFTPGKQDFKSTDGNSYSNFGYVLLGVVAEKVTGQSFVEFVRSGPLKRDGTEEVFLAHTAASKRMPREVWYEDPGTGPSALDPKSDTPVPNQYGGEGWMTELMDSGGGLATTAATLAKFISKHAVWDMGGRSAGSEREGSMAGTTSYSFSRPNGVDCVVIFNTRSFKSGGSAFDDLTNKIRGLLDSTQFS
jgi:CubicO group peptidase (beta-lactamase class C family)